MLTLVAMNFAFVTSGLILWSPISESSSCPFDCRVLALTIIYVCLSICYSSMRDFWLAFNTDVQERKG